MLYLRALFGGLATLPKGSDSIRAVIDADARRLGWAAMHARLREVDAILVNCGVTHPVPVWLAALATGGRALVPVTASANASGIGTGAMFMIAREHDHFDVAYVSPVGIFPCAGGRSDALNAKLLAKPEASWREVRSIRLEPHDEEPSCWLHAAACLSTASRAT